MSVCFVPGLLVSLQCFILSLGWVLNVSYVRVYEDLFINNDLALKNDNISVGEGGNNCTNFHS